MHRADYVIKRLAFAVMTVFVAITINFVLFRALPGNAVADLARAPHASPAAAGGAHARVRPGQAAAGSNTSCTSTSSSSTRTWGSRSPIRSRSTTNLTDKLKNTIPMVMIGTLLAIAIGIVTGFLSAWRRSGIVDQVSTNAAIVFYALPTQFIGMMLILLFAGTLPTSGMRNEVNNFFSPGDTLSNLKDIGLHMLLPAFTLALTLFGEYTLIVRSSMLETLGEDYVLTARAKGLPQRRIVRQACAAATRCCPSSRSWRCRWGSSWPARSSIEIVFSWPGIGQAVYRRSPSATTRCCRARSWSSRVSVVFFNFIADLIYFKLDPRISE